MKFSVVFFVAMLIIVKCSGYPAAENYGTKWDNIDVDEILHSERLLDNYFDCFMDRKPCTPHGDDIKKNLPDALKTECAKCTEKQKENARKTLNFLLEEKPALYKELEDKYDQEQVYRKKKEEVGKF